MDALIAGLKDRPIPQMLGAIKPRQLPAEESDKESQAALKAMG